jgi:hypothetical protein
VGQRLELEHGGKYWKARKLFIVHI